jgi:hypothetical protein
LNDHQFLTTICLIRKYNFLLHKEHNGLTVAVAQR